MLDASVTVHFDLPASYVALLMQGLDQLPHGVVRACVDEMRRQITAQHPQAFGASPVVQAPQLNGFDPPAA